MCGSACPFSSCISQAEYPGPASHVTASLHSSLNNLGRRAARKSTSRRSIVRGVVEKVPIFGTYGVSVTLLRLASRSPPRGGS